MSRVRIQNLVKRYGPTLAVNDVSLDVAEGEFLTMLGSSGCGKTTTLRCVAGLEMPDGGEIFFDERPTSRVPPYERSCGMVFQNYALFPHMTVEENLAYGLMAGRYRQAGLGAKVAMLLKSVLSSIEPADRDRIRESLEMVELPQHGQRKPGQLSGGQQQRVALARALITHPRVLLFDEPLGALDAQLRVKMREEIRRIQKRAGITTLYVTHDQEEALAISDRIAVMRGGVIAQLGTPEDIYRRPRTRFIADFIGLGNIFEAKADGSQAVRVGNNGGSLRMAVTGALPATETLNVAVRPEAIRFLEPGQDVPNAFDGVVTLRMFMGTSVKYLVRSGDLEFIVKMPDQGGRQVGMDEPVRFAFSPEDVLVMEAD